MELHYVVASGYIQFESFDILWKDGGEADNKMFMSMMMLCSLASYPLRRRSVASLPLPPPPLMCLLTGTPGDSTIIVPCAIPPFSSFNDRTFFSLLLSLCLTSAPIFQRILNGTFGAVRLVFENGDHLRLPATGYGLNVPACEMTTKIWNWLSCKMPNWTIDFYFGVDGKWNECGRLEGKSRWRYNLNKCRSFL